jgi:hypothetical protein
MSLLAQLRKRQSERFATATPATVATPMQDKGRTVASVATVAVAKFPHEHTTPMTVEEEQTIRAWLELIEETDLEAIAEVISKCHRDVSARDYFSGRAAVELPKPDPFPDDRRTCSQCVNLIAQRCQAAKRGAIVASLNYEPICDLPRRCEGYAPGVDDPDRRHGRERWPELIQIGAKDGDEV